MELKDFHSFSHLAWVVCERPNLGWRGAIYLKARRSQKPAAKWVLHFPSSTISVLISICHKISIHALIFLLRGENKPKQNMTQFKLEISIFWYQSKLDYKENIALFQISRMHTFWGRENTADDRNLTMVPLTAQKNLRMGRVSQWHLKTIENYRCE